MVRLDLDACSTRRSVMARAASDPGVVKQVIKSTDCLNAARVLSLGECLVRFAA